MFFLTESVLRDFGYFDVGLFLRKYFFLESMNFPKTFLEIPTCSALHQRGSSVAKYLNCTNARNPSANPDRV